MFPPRGNTVQGCRQCFFSCIPDTLVFLLWIPDFAPGRRPGPEMGVDFDQTVADFLKKINLHISLAALSRKDIAEILIK